LSNVCRCPQGGGDGDGESQADPLSAAGYSIGEEMREWEVSPEI